MESNQVKKKEEKAEAMLSIFFYVVYIKIFKSSPTKVYKLLYRLLAFLVLYGKRKETQFTNCNKFQ